MVSAYTEAIEAPWECQSQQVVSIDLHEAPYPRSCDL